MRPSARHHRVLVPLALLAAIAAPASAQGRPRNGPDCGLLGGLRFGSAQRQAAYTGLWCVTKSAAGERSGPSLELEYGRSGGQIALGATSTGASATVGRLQAVLLRTWGRATDIAPGQTFVGVEAQVSELLGVSAGAYRRVRGSAAGDTGFLGVRFVLGF
jgi:hypothetical protein